MKFPTFDLTGQVALVTGATKNIGHALALGLANAGADIVVVGRTVSECESTAEEIRAMGRRALAVPTDVTDQCAINARVGKAMAEGGRREILVLIGGAALT